ncbi:MAG: cell division protein FtsL [Lachnospiraceae bacterium]|nr:cell division protein FtsL [Lachnospiraceae bacterium]
MRQARGVQNDIVRNRTYHQYVMGNVATKEDYYEQPQRRTEQRMQPKKQVRQEAMSAPYVLFLVAAAILAVCMCVAYLNIQLEISETKSNISQLKSTIDTVTSQNDSIDYEINSNMDLEYIYKTATEELGMVQASKEQISLYDQTEKEYMKQFHTIP